MEHNILQEANCALEVNGPSFFIVILSIDMFGKKLI